MARAQRQLDPAIKALVDDRLKSNECIHSWSRIRPDEVFVKLIDKDLQRTCQELHHRLGSGGGGGRALIFRSEDGLWSFAGVDGWIA